MKIAALLIVYNGQPYVGKCIRHYADCPWIDYLCVAEGATVNMVRALDLKTTRSTDGTMEAITEYSSHPKILWTFRNDPYVEKVDQSNAAMSVVPDDTDFIWVIAADEFYHYADILTMRTTMESGGYTFASVLMHHFWKNTGTVGVGGRGYGYDQQIERIFKYHPGARFADHRTIDLTDQSGRSVKSINPLHAKDHNVRCYHYSYVDERMVREKMQYYTVTMGRNYMPWFENCWKAWTPQNRKLIEAQYSVHPSCAGATTREITLNHPI